MKNIPYFTLCLFSTFLNPTLLLSDAPLHHQTLEDLPAYDAILHKVETGLSSPLPSLLNPQVLQAV